MYVRSEPMARPFRLAFRTQVPPEAGSWPQSLPYRWRISCCQRTPAVFVALERLPRAPRPLKPSQAAGRAGGRGEPLERPTDGQGALASASHNACAGGIGRHVPPRTELCFPRALVGRTCCPIVGARVVAEAPWPPLFHSSDCPTHPPLSLAANAPWPSSLRSGNCPAHRPSLSLPKHFGSRCVARAKAPPTRPFLSVPAHAGRLCCARETAPPTRPFLSLPKHIGSSCVAPAKAPPAHPLLPLPKHVGGRRGSSGGIPTYPPLKQWPSRRAGGWERRAAGAPQWRPRSFGKGKP